MRPIARHPYLILALGLVLGLAAPALAQRGRTVYPDEGVGTTDALVRVRELSEAGNTPEALRVLQKTLEAEGEQLIASPADKDVFIPVRGFIHDLLLSSPDLLSRYRTEQEPAAAKLLEAGKFNELEQTRLLTTSGFEAVLRLSQTELEAARFESARLMLQQLERHPDRTKGSRQAADAAKLAGAIAGFLKRTETSAWAQRWASEAGLSGTVIPTAIPAAPAISIKSSASPLDNQLTPDLSNIPGTPLQSITLEPGRIVDRDGDGIPDDNRVYQQRNKTPWMFPTVQGDVVYVNDGERITAWDSATLGQVWQVSPTRTSAALRQFNDDNGFFPNAQPGAFMKDDVASVTILNGIAIAVTGQPENGMRRGDKRVHAIEIASGKLLWSVDPAFLSPKLQNADGSSPASVRGPAVIDADTVVLALRRTRQFMRGDTSLYEVGLSLYTGNLKWVRLIASVGNQPWGRVSGRPDGAIVHQGVVYRGDEMGLLCAYEAATGRAVWVRLSPGKVFDPAQFRAAENTPPEQMTIPVVDNDALLFVEAPKGRVVRVALADGKLLASLEAPRLDSPRYLVKVGDTIAAVNSSKIAFVNPQLDPATISLSSSFAKPGIVGRAESAGGQLLVPLEGGAALIDPAHPSDEQRAEFTYSGNLLVAGSGGRTHLLAADIARLHTYLEWDQAESLLNARVAAHPKDPQPLLTYLELASRTGRGERLGELADRTLDLLNADPTSAASLQSRQRLFTLLLEVVRNSRFAWATQATPKIPGAAQPLKNLAILDDVVERMSRAAESPSQQVFTLLEKAWLREKENKPDKAIEAYQQILTDTSLCAVELDPGARLGAGDTGSASARIETTDRLTALIKRTGPAPYLAYDEEAQRALAELEGGAPEKLAALAKSYPVAAVAPEAWNRASAAYAQAGRTAEARLAAGAGLGAAELGASIGREGQLEMLGKLSDSLLALSRGTTDSEPAFRLMRRLAHDHPAVSVTWDSRKMTPGEAAGLLHDRLAERTGLPIIGTHISHAVQVIENWEPVEPLVRGSTGFSGDTAIMINDGSKQVGLWGVGAEDGRLHQLWSRPYQIRPIVIRVAPESALLFWPSNVGGAIEAIGLDGTSLWRTHEFATLFGTGEVADGRNPQMPAERINTPLDGPVRPEDLMVSADGKMLVLVQRRGRAGAFDLTDGHTIWSKSLEQLTRAYDVEQAGDCIVISGAGNPGRGADKTGSLLLALDKKTGVVKSRIDQTVLGDHARWCRAVGKDMVVATSEGLFRYDPATGKIAWKVDGTPGRGSFAGWVVGEGLFVLDSDVNLWHVSLRDGKASAAPLDARNRITFPVSAAVMGKTLAVSSTQGLVVFAENGDVIGADGLDGQGVIQTPVPSENMFVAVENNQHDDSDQGIVSKLYLFSHPSGKLVATERIRLFENPRQTTVLDGKILLCEGPVTLVLDAPADSKP
jgi:outer membrane protein assembly factor BamB